MMHGQILNLSFTDSFIDESDLVEDKSDEVTRRYTPGELEKLLIEASPRRCATKRLPTSKRRSVRP